MSNNTSFVKITGLLLPLAIGCGEKETDTAGPAIEETDVITNPPPPDEPVTEGQVTFENSCSGCHGADGDSGSSPQLSSVVPPLSDEELTDVIVNGKGSMPGGLVQEADVPALVSYLRDTFQ